jgi:hypothetical protein
MLGKDIIKAAVEAATVAEAETVQKMIAEAIGAEYRRPLGDKPNNAGLIKGAGGSYDHKIIENLTNMQDAVLERAAIGRFGGLASVPFDSPHTAAASLFPRRDKQVAGLLTVTFRESDPPARRNKRLTVVFRDQGCGMTAAQVPETIFALGAEHKEGIAWLQGAFGLGGAMTFYNAKAVVLITRRAPELLGPQERDEIVVAVLEWKRRLKNDGASYLVTAPWNGPGAAALPYVIPASECPDFAPGTHLSLISYGVEGYHRARHGDDKSFVTVADTRLFDPVLPIHFSDQVHEHADPRILGGLRAKLDRNPRQDRKQGDRLLPFHIGGTTYQLPVRYWSFARKGEPGERKNSVANDHTVLLTSNGQVHKHWTPQEFKARTGLTHLADRLLVAVETDVLPIEVRTSLFTADRSDTVRTEEAIKLQETVAATLRDWDELVTLENELVREAISGRADGRPTRDIAEQISRALRYPGFAEGGRGSGGGLGARPPRQPRPPRELHDDPTTLTGPEQVTAEAGKTKSVTFLLDAVDDFIPRRTQLTVRCDHPEIIDAEITVGSLRNGRVQALFAVPSGGDLGIYRLQVEVSGWLKLSGGLGPDLRWETKLEVVDRERPRSRRRGGGPGEGNSGPGPGNQVALIWATHEEREGWTAATVGEVEDAAARDLAQQNPEYADLAVLGDRKIPTLVLNEHFAPLKSYLSGRARTLSRDWIDRLKDQYAVGVGVGLLFLKQQNELRQQDERERRRNGEPLSNDGVVLARQTLAKGVLSTLPRFDELARSLDPNSPD